MTYFRISLIYAVLFSFAMATANEGVATSTGPQGDDLQKESSAFVGDPDPLDPLPSKQENLKDDEEPVLEDIRGVLNARSKKKTQPPAQKNNEAAPVADLPPPPEIKAEQPEPTSPPVQMKLKVKKSSKKRTSKNNNNENNNENNIAPLPPNPEASPDAADLGYEEKLFKINKAYNADPTSPERWGAAIKDRAVEVFDVEQGNTLEGISRTLFGDSSFWPKIWALNHSQISNPHRIYPGQKIYFYPASANELPAVAIESASSSQAPAEVSSTVEPLITRQGQSLDGRDYSPQDTYFVKYGIKGIKNHRFKGPTPQPLPDSLPLVRSKDYFIKKKDTQVVSDLSNFVLPEKIPTSTPYILTAEKIQGDFQVPSDQSNSLICRTNQFISVVKKINPQAIPGKYTLIENLTRPNSRLKSTYVYRIIGTAEINESLQLRIKSCTSLLNSDVVIVSTDKVVSFTPPKEIVSPESALVEGLEVPAQDFFNFGQLIIVSSGAEKTPAGQAFDVFSDDVGEVAGRIQIIKNTGTLSIGYLTDIGHLLKLNDKIKASSEFSPNSSQPSINQELMPTDETDLIIE